MQTNHELMQKMYADVKQSNDHNAIRIGQNSATLQELWAVIDQNISTSIDEHDQFAADSKRHHSLQDEQLTAWNKDCLEYSNTNEESIQKMLAKNSERQALLDVQKTETLNMLNSQTDSIANRIRQLETEITQLETNAVKSFAGATEETLANLQTATTRQDDWNSVSVSLNTAMARDIEEYGNSVQQHVHEWCNRLDTFHRNEMQTYRSTGDTPAKREFNYPKQLAQTSPHDRLVRRFWSNVDGNVADLDCSVTICEGSEHTFLEGITDERSSSILVKPDVVVTPCSNRLSRNALHQLPGSNVINKDGLSVKTPGGRRSLSANTSPDSRSRSHSGNRRLSTSDANKENLC